MTTQTEQTDQRTPTEIDPNAPPARPRIEYQSRTTRIVSTWVHGSDCPRSRGLSNPCAMEECGWSCITEVHRPYDDDVLGAPRWQFPAEERDWRLIARDLAWSHMPPGPRAPHSFHGWDDDAEPVPPDSSFGDDSDQD